jgi:hypothetical protein
MVKEKFLQEIRNKLSPIKQHLWLIKALEKEKSKPNIDKNKIENLEKYLEVEENKAAEALSKIELLIELFENSN